MDQLNKSQLASLSEEEQAELADYLSKKYHLFIDSTKVEAEDQAIQVIEVKNSQSLYHETRFEEEGEEDNERAIENPE